VVLPLASSDDPRCVVGQQPPHRRTCTASRVRSSSRSRSHRVSSFRGLPQSVTSRTQNCLDFGWPSRLQKRACWRGPAVTGMRTCPPPRVVHSHRRNGRRSGRTAVRPLAAGGFAQRAVWTKASRHLPAVPSKSPLPTSSWTRDTRRCARAVKWPTAKAVHRGRTSSLACANAASTASSSSSPTIMPAFARPTRPFHFATRHGHHTHAPLRAPLESLVPDPTRGRAFG
jgi:hypothetical protein